MLTRAISHCAACAEREVEKGREDKRREAVRREGTSGEKIMVEMVMVAKK